MPTSRPTLERTGGSLARAPCGRPRSRADSDKRKLCALLGAIDPSLCQVLASKEARDGLQQRMESSVATDQLWVLKRDVIGGGSNLHSGKAVSFVHRWEEVVSTVANWTALGKAGELQWREGLVQPYMPPFVGKPPYNRKSELRIFLAVVDTAPLEIYAYADINVILATQTFDDTKKVNASKCMHDTHFGAACQGYGGGDNIAAQVDGARKTPRDAGTSLNTDLATYGEGVGWSAAETERIAQRALTLLGKVMYHQDAAQVLQRHPINRKIAEKKARCFSVIRADLGLSTSLNPVLFEINDWPWLDTDGSKVQDSIVWRAHRELFQMLGLDVPAVQGRRQAINRDFMGRWRPLHPALENARLERSIAGKKEEKKDSSATGNTAE